VGVYVSQGKILATTLPLPPPDEQAEIARRVAALMSAADRLERRIDATAERIARGSQSVLGKALRGDLNLNGTAGEATEGSIAAAAAK
jgi:type I restriction enzyme, S subunit